MNAWITTQHNRLVAFRTYDGPRFAELVVTHYPGEPRGFSWVGLTYLPLRVSPEMLRGVSLPWAMGVVRYDFWTPCPVMARRDG